MTVELKLRLESFLKEVKLVPVLRSDTPEQAVELGETLLSAGLRCLEITFTIPSAMHVIEHFANRPNVLVGAGTVLNVAQAETAVEAGAQFLISPGWSDSVSEVANRCSIPYIPGVFTPSEIMVAHGRGHRLLKLFPAGVQGLPYFKSLLAPFPQISFMTTGGIEPDEAVKWLQAGAVAVGMGSALAKGTQAEIAARVESILQGI